MFETLGANILAAAIVGGGVAVYQTQEEKKAQKRAQSKAKEMLQSQQQYETEAGEHWEQLGREQMELQSQQHQITLLADIIKKEQDPAPQAVTLPPAKTYSPVDRINIENGKLFAR